jgi:hypothetical protein
MQPWLYASRLRRALLDLHQARSPRPVHACDMWWNNWMPWMFFGPAMMLIFLAVCVALGYLLMRAGHRPARAERSTSCESAMRAAKSISVSSRSAAACSSVKRYWTGV